MNVLHQIVKYCGNCFVELFHQLDLVWLLEEIRDHLQKENYSDNYFNPEENIEKEIHLHFRFNIFLGIKTNRVQDSFETEKINNQMDLEYWDDHYK